MLVEQYSQKLRFSLLSTEPRAFLCARRNDGQFFTFQMIQSRPGFWFADVPLAQGTYRMRYYCGDDHQITYYGPASAPGSVPDGMDGLIVVESQKCIDSDDTMHVP
jgi:hypothetical protein